LDPKAFIPLLYPYLEDGRFDKEDLKAAICKLNDNTLLVKSFPQLVWSDGLALAAKEQCEYLGPLGLGGSTNVRTGQTLLERLAKYGSVTLPTTEAILYGDGTAAL
jgi:uncharacterized protein YkwD